MPFNGLLTVRNSQVVYCFADCPALRVVLCVEAPRRRCVACFIAYSKLRKPVQRTTKTRHSSLSELRVCAELAEIRLLLAACPKHEPRWAQTTWQTWRSKRRHSGERLVYFVQCPNPAARCRSLDRKNPAPFFFYWFIVYVRLQSWYVFCLPTRTSSLLGHFVCQKSWLMASFISRKCAIGSTWVLSGVYKRQSQPSWSSFCFQPLMREPFLNRSELKLGTRSAQLSALAEHTPRGCGWWI